MSIKDLQKLRKTEFKVASEEYVRFLVVGGDLWASAAALKLADQHGDAQVKVLSDRLLVAEDLELMGPDWARGGEGEGQRLTPFFYKDQEFRKFGGRSKPQPLHAGEEFFAQDALLGAQEKALSSLGRLPLERLNAMLVVGAVAEVAEHQGLDLVSPSHWSVLLMNGRKLLCEKLVWAHSPKQFLEKYANKSALPTEFVQYVDSTNAPAALFVRYQLKKSIDERKETFFLPLSMTHEHGHFIGQFHSGGEEGGQRLEFVYFLDPEQVDEENLSKNVRHLRRTVEKIFPEFEKNLRGEFIRLSENSACQKVDDQAFAQAASRLENVRFTGVNAPLGDADSMANKFEDSKNEVSHLARALQSLQNL